jgi:hypothetical protein
MCSEYRHTIDFFSRDAAPNSAGRARAVAKGPEKSRPKVTILLRDGVYMMKYGGVEKDWTKNIKCKVQKRENWPAVTNGK